MPLTDTAIRKAKPGDKPYKLPDEKGLFLLLHPNGSKYWRQKNTDLPAKKKRLPTVFIPMSVSRLPEKNAMQLAAGGENKKAVKAAQVLRTSNSFEVIAREWFQKNRDIWAPSHADKIIARLERDVFPWLGSAPKRRQQTDIASAVEYWKDWQRRHK